MYCCSLPGIVGVAVVFGLLAYVLYIPIHDDIADRLQAYAAVHGFRFFFGMGDLLKALGFGSSAKVTRRLIDMTVGTPSETDGLQKENLIFDGTPVRVYRPKKAATPTPCVVYIHGGGWSILSVDVYDYVVSELAMRSGYTFVSVEYRLAPEYPFPIPFEDSYRAVYHLLTNAAKYDVDPNRIAISGDSAGGNLAAVVALKLSEEKTIPRLKFQWLIYPVTQGLDFRLPSYITNSHSTPYFLSTLVMIRYWCNYLGIPYSSSNIEAFLANAHVSEKLRQSSYAQFVDRTQLPERYHGVVTEMTESVPTDETLANQIEDTLLNPYLSPLLASDLSRVPPAFVVTAEYDVLRDDGLLYAHRMSQAGVQVETYNSPRSCHAFLFWDGGLSTKGHDVENTLQKFLNFAKMHFK